MIPPQVSFIYFHYTVRCYPLHEYFDNFYIYVANFNVLTALGYTYMAVQKLLALQNISNNHEKKPVLPKTTHTGLFLYSFLSLIICRNASSAVFSPPICDMSPISTASRPSMIEPTSVAIWSVCMSREVNFSFDTPE